mgnify:CR=1 FL=1
MEKIIVFFAKKTMLVNIIVMAVLFVGGYSYFNLQKESFPSTDLDMMLIAVTNPGATPWMWNKTPLYQSKNNFKE